MMAFKLLLLPITVPAFCVGFLIRALMTVALYSMLFVLGAKEYVVNAFDRGLGVD